MSELVPCPACRRHVRPRAPCTFCARRTGAGGLVVGVALAAFATACAGETQRPVVIDAVPPAASTSAPPPDSVTPPPPAPPPTASAGSTSRPPPRKRGEPQPVEPEYRVVPLYGGPPPPDSEIV